jgi:hypothetical protein
VHTKEKRQIGNEKRECCKALMWIVEVDGLKNIAGTMNIFISEPPEGSVVIKRQNRSRSCAQRVAVHRFWRST